MFCCIPITRKTYVQNGLIKVPQQTIAPEKVYTSGCMWWLILPYISLDHFKQILNK